MNCVLSGLLQVIGKIPLLGCDEVSDSRSSSVQVLHTVLDLPLGKQIHSRFFFKKLLQKEH